MIDELFENKLVKFSVLGAAGFNILRSAVASLSRTQVNQMGVMSVILGVLCIAAMITTSRYIPFIGPLAAAVIIYLPGAFIGAIIRVVVLYGIAALIATPVIYIIEVLATVFPWLLL